jgi:hypothetical protein
MVAAFGMTSKQQRPKMSNSYRLALRSILLALLFVGNNLSDLHAQDTAAIYYIAYEEGIHRIVNLGSLSELGNTQPEVIAYRMEEYRLSHDGQRIAFWNKDGLWLSNLNHWNPQLVVPDKRNLDFRFYWMLDDTRIFFEISSLGVPSARPIEYETLAYNLLTGEVESWPWGDCDEMARHVQTGQLVMVCYALPWTWQENPMPTTIALHWGGEY